MRFPLWRRRREEGLEEELQSHLEMAKRDRMERGESAEDAAAHRKLTSRVLCYANANLTRSGPVNMAQLLA